MTGAARRTRTGTARVPSAPAWLIVYRDRSKPLTAIVIYDGGFTKSASATMNQTIAGFYQASSVAPSARMTHIVGDGRPFLSERLLLDGQTIATNPFAAHQRTEMGHAGRFRWTANWPATPPRRLFASSPQGWLPDCLSWSAIVFSNDGSGQR